MNQPGIAQLAQSVATTLAPFLPYLIEGVKLLGKEAIKTIGKKTVEAGWEKATDIWKKLFPQIEKQTEVKHRLEELARIPQDPRFNTLLSYEIQKVLAKLPKEDLIEIKKTTYDLSSEINIAIAKGDRSFANVGDIKGSTIITGDIDKKPKKNK